MDVFLVLFVGALIVLLTLANPYLGLLIYLGLIYMRPQDLYPVLAPYHLVRIMAIILLISVLLRSKHASEAKKPVPPQTKFFLGWLFFILLSAFPGWWPYSWITFYELTKIFIAYLLIIKLADSESKIRGVIWTLLLLNSVIALDSVIKYFKVAGTERIGGFSGAYFGNAGDLAVMLNVVIPIAFLMLWVRIGWLTVWAPKVMPF